MAIPVTIQQLLNDNIVEWARIEFKEGWNPDETLNTISAFANDIDNWGGGYIVIGVEEKDGQIVRPIKGLQKNQLEPIQKDMLRYCKYLTPNYLPVVEPVKYEGKDLLLVWCPGGYDRPYQCPIHPTSKSKEKAYYIRKFANTIEATNLDLDELQALRNNVPFDDRINPKAEMSDLKYPLIMNYLTEVNSALLPNANDKTVKDLSIDLKIADGPNEYFKPINAGLLFFTDDVEKFFPYTRIEIVNIPDPTGQGMEERIFKGPIDQQLNSALAYIRNNVIAEKVFKVKGQAEAIRVFNYSYEAIEEFLSNAVYHKSYQEHEPITVRIEKDNIEITSIPGPDRSISDEDIKNYTMRARRYRNRRIGDFLKELHLIEGRNTGIPTALRAIKANGSPLPKLITDKERTFFSVIIPIHSAFTSSMENTYIREQNTKKQTRRNKDEIKNEILKSLENGNYSASTVYHDMGYSGNLSNAFRNSIEELVAEGKISYKEKNKNSPTNVLVKNKKRKG